MRGPERLRLEVECLSLAILRLLKACCCVAPLQVFKWMGVPWTDLSKPAGSTCAAVYFAEKQGAKICFQVAGFSTPRHAGITVKWAASKMGMDIRKLDYIAVGAHSSASALTCQQKSQAKSCRHTLYPCMVPQSTPSTMPSTVPEDLIRLHCNCWLYAAA